MKTRLTLLYALIAATTMMAQTVPPLMNYQGRLTDESGTALPDGNYRLAFRLYSNPVPIADEPLVWGREYDATLLGGAFNVVLGAEGAGPVGEQAAVNDLSFAFTDSNRFLELRIVRDAANNTEPRTILPRQQLLSAPYALQAGRLIKEFQEALCPPGTIVAFGGPVVPEGWLLCDGRSLSRSQQPRLFAAIGTAWGSSDSTSFHLPELRGMFLRGVSGGLDHDPDRNSRTSSNPSGNTGNAVGSLQGSTIGNHTHGGGTGTANGNLTARIYISDSDNVWAAERTIAEWLPKSQGANATFVDWPSGLRSSSGAVVVGATSVNNAQTSESRPVNAYVNYIIKY